MSKLIVSHKEAQNTEKVEAFRLTLSSRPMNKYGTGPKGRKISYSLTRP